MKCEIRLVVFILIFGLSTQEKTDVLSEKLSNIENVIKPQILQGDPERETSEEKNDYLLTGQEENFDYDEELERVNLKPVDIALAAIYVIITVVGLFANGIVFFVIFGRREINKTVTAMYVVQLAFADSLFLLSVPIFGMQKATHTWSFGSVMCSICTSLKFFNCFAGVFFLTAMSVDRYIAVAHSITGTQLRTRKRTLTACAILWILSAIMSLPTLIYSRTETIDKTVFCRLQFPGYQVYSENDTIEIVYEIASGAGTEAYFKDSNTEMAEAENFEYIGYIDEIPDNLDYKNLYYNSSWDEKYPYCVHEQGNIYNIWIIIHFVIGFLLPFLIITISYILIIKHLQSREASVSSMTRKNSQTTRKKVTRTVASLVVCFAICWLPYHIFKLIKIAGFNSYVTTCFGIEQFVIALAYSNSAFNPILYTFLGHNFKERFRESVKQTKRRWSRFPSATGPIARSHSDQGNNSFSKKISNMVVFRKASRPHTSVGSDNVFLETFSTKTKRARISIPLLDSNKKREQNSGSDRHPDQKKQLADCTSRTNHTEFTRVHTGLR